MKFIEPMKIKRDEDIGRNEVHRETSMNQIGASLQPFLTKRNLQLIIL
ncbi:hypothetical protein [Robertmurraya sp. P23]